MAADSGWGCRLRSNLDHEVTERPRRGALNFGVEPIGDRLAAPGQYGDTGCRSRRSVGFARRWSGWPVTPLSSNTSSRSSFLGEGNHHALRQLVERICAVTVIRVRVVAHDRQFQDPAPQRRSSRRTSEVSVGPAVSVEARRGEAQSAAAFPCAVRLPNTAPTRRTRRPDGKRTQHFACAGETVGAVHRFTVRRIRAREDRSRAA